MANGIKAWVQRLFGSTNGQAVPDVVAPAAKSLATDVVDQEAATSEALPPQPAAQAENPTVHAANQTATATQHDLWQSLNARQQSGWRSLQESGVVAALRQASNRRKWVWVESAQGLVDLACSISSDGAEMLFCLSHAMAFHASQSPAPAPLPVPARQVVLALCAVAMERWVSQVKLPPCADGGIHLSVEDLHTVYHLTAAAFKLKNRLYPAMHRAPALILPNAPLELDNADLLAPTRLELAAAMRGIAPANPLGNSQQSTMPKPPSTEYIQRILYELEDKLGSAPVLGVRASDAGNALLGSPVQQQAFDLFGTPTAVFGEGAQCEATLHRFATDLQNMIFDLHRKLFPQPEKTQGDTMSQPQDPVPEPQQPPPTVIVKGGNAIFNYGDHNNSALLNKSRAKDVVVGNVSNHGDNAASFEALLDAFLNQTTVLSEKKQAALQNHAKELATLAATPEAERGEAVGKQVKAVLDGMDAIIDGADKAEQVMGKFEAVVEFFKTHWFSVAGLFS